MTEVGILTFMCLIKVIKLNNYVRDNGKAMDSLLHHKVLFIIIIVLYPEGISKPIQFTKDENKESMSYLKFLACLGTSVH